MRRIDELYTAWPFLGSRRMTALLRVEGHRINRKRVQRLMRRMGIAALGPKPRTTKPAPRHKIFPLSIAPPGDRAAEPGVGGRYHLCPDRTGISLPGGDHRLGEPGRPGLADVEHDGCRVLPRGAGRGADTVRQAGDLQHLNTDQGSQFTRRPHQALASRTPMAVWRAGADGALGAQAVDMTLRLDNAGASPTSPQPQQQPPQELVA
jgi:hypothetical protein